GSAGSMASPDDDPRPGQDPAQGLGAAYRSSSRTTQFGERQGLNSRCYLTERPMAEPWQAGLTPIGKELVTCWPECKHHNCISPSHATRVRSAKPRRRTLTGRLPGIDEGGGPTCEPAGAGSRGEAGTPAGHLTAR